MTVETVKLADYFGPDVVHRAYVKEAYFPGKGWCDLGSIPDIPSRMAEFLPFSVTQVENLRATGATAVAIACGPRLADFRVEELIPKVGLRG